MYEVNEFLKDIQNQDTNVQYKVAKEFLDRIQQSFNPDSYAMFYDYFMDSHSCQ